MIGPFPIDAKLIERFLRTQHFRHPITPKNYAGTLRNFNGFVAKHGADAPPTVPMMQQWLKERSLKWPAHILYHRTLLVERYLQWLHKQGVIASNPFAELHRQYGPRTTPIIRALVSDDSNTLEQLRQLPPFGSFLGRVMEEHVAHMRMLGYRYDTNEELLLRFDRFLQRRPELSGLPLDSLVEHWNEEQPSPYRLYDARRAGRIVSKAMHRLDPRVPVLPIGDGVARAARQHQRSAHLYTDEEVRRILRAALAYPSPKAPWRPLSLFTMLDACLLRRFAGRRDRAPEARGCRSAAGDHRHPRDEVLQASPLACGPRSNGRSQGLSLHASRCGCPDESRQSPVLESAAKPRLLRRRYAARADGRTAARGRQTSARRSRSTNP